jgi:ABC-type multidrug transport system ATPase subunit
MSINCKNITIKHHRQTILSNFNLELPSNQIIALYGPTGSGKTTLLLLLAGLLKPYKGGVNVDGIDVFRDIQKARLHVGFGIIPEFNPLLSNLSVEENLMFQARALKVKHPKENVREIVHNFSLESEKRQRVDHLPALKYAETGLAMALIGHPNLVLLDEPEHSLTTEETSTLWNSFDDLIRTGKTIIITTRLRETANRCDQIVYMPSGKVVDRHELTQNSSSGT